MIHYGSDFQTISFFRDSEILEQNWFDHSKLLTEESFEAEISVWLDMVKRFQPEKLLINLERLFYCFPIEWEKHLREIFCIAIESAPIQKIAFLKSEHLPTLLLFHELISKPTTSMPPAEWFRDENEASKWLHGDDKADKYKLHFNMHKVA